MCCEARPLMLVSEADFIFLPHIFPFSLIISLHGVLHSHLNLLNISEYTWGLYFAFFNSNANGIHESLMGFTKNLFDLFTGELDIGRHRQKGKDFLSACQGHSYKVCNVHIWSKNFFFKNSGASGKGSARSRSCDRKKAWSSINH
jgi:hypothetical protein